MAAEQTGGGDEDIERHVKRRFEICQRLGKGARGAGARKLATAEAGPRPVFAAPRTEGADRKAACECQTTGARRYGIVWKAVEKRSQQTVALKKCFDASARTARRRRVFFSARSVERARAPEHLSTTPSRPVRASTAVGRDEVRER